MTVSLLLAFVTQMPAVGEAQTTLISNVNQDQEVDVTDEGLAQVFTTGTHTGGYSLQSVGIRFGGGVNGGTAGAAIYTVSGGQPDALLHALTAPDTLISGISTFTAPAGAKLAASTDYAVVIEPAGYIIYFAANTGATDAAAAGWSFDSSHLQGPPSWTEEENLTLSMTITGDTVTVANNPATGKPAISGTPQADETLTASTTDIEDDDGLGAFAYQWIRVDGLTETDISGATNSTYQPGASDVGKRIKVVVSFTDGEGTDEEVTSDAYPSRGYPATHIGIVAAAAACPGASDWCAELTVGVHAQGSTTNYGYDGASGTGALDDTMIGYQGTSYSVSAIRVADGIADSLMIQLDAFLPDGSVFTVGGQTYTANSASRQASAGRYAWGQVASLRFVEGAEVTVSVVLGNFPATGMPAISGPTRVGQTLSAGPGDILDVDGLTNPGYTYQWQRVDGGTATDITGATSSSYTLADDDAGKKLSVTLSFTDDAGNAESRTSDAYPSSGAITAGANSPATGAPAISGPPIAGQTLSASKGTIADADGLTRADNGEAGHAYEYQWIRLDDNLLPANIPGATSSTYTLVDADQGTRIRVLASFTDDASNAESRASQSTAAIAPNLPTLVISATSAVVSEGDTALFLVGLVAPVDSGVVVTTAFSQTGSFWAQAPPSSVMFAAGETQVEVAVATVDDEVSEDNGRITGEVLPGDGYFVGTHNSVYIEVLDNDSPLGICPRTGAVRERILILLRHRHRYKGDCTGVTDSELAQLTSLDLDYSGIDALQTGDFAGLSSLTYLSLGDNELQTLPPGVFSGLDALANLRLSGNRLTAPLDNVFVNLPALEKLSLTSNNLDGFPFDDLETLPLLTKLYIGGNPGAGYKVQISPLDLVVSGTDTVMYRVRLMRMPGGLDPVRITPHPPGTINLWPESLAFSRSDWFRSQVFSLTSSDETGSPQLITHSITSGYFPDRAIDAVEVRRASAAISGTDSDETVLAADAEAIALVEGLSPRQAAAVLFGDAKLEAGQLRALDHLGNRNGRYDHGDFMSWLARCRLGGVDCSAGNSPARTDGDALPPGGQGGRTPRTRRRGDGRTRVRSGDSGDCSRMSAVRRHRDPSDAGSHSASRWRLAALIAVLLTWACMGDDMTRPQTDAPVVPAVERPLLVTLESPPETRDISAMLRVEGFAVDSVRAPGFELFASDASGPRSRHFVVAGNLSTGTILEIWVPSGRDPGDYHVELLEVAAEDYSLRDLTGYRTTVGR